jgi:hypothetical protein
MVAFSLGLFVMLAAYLAAHDTPIPKIPRMGIVWASGLGLLLLSGLLAYTPNLFAYRNCETTCNVIDDASQAETSTNVSVARDFAACLSGSRAQVRKDAEARAEADDTVDPDSAVAEAEDGIQDLCRSMILSVCVGQCYNEQPEAVEAI